MELDRCKRTMTTIISLSLILAFGVITSTAEEKIKRSDKRYGVTTKVEMIKVDDTEGHIIQIAESTGFDVSTGAVAVTRNLYDLIKGNGTVQGYTTIKDPDGGNVRYTKAVGKVTTTLSPAGKPIMIMEGTYSFVRGTGTWEGFQGGGTWKGQILGGGVYTMDWEGEFTKKQ